MAGTLLSARSKGWEIQAFSEPCNDDVINVNDVISPPISYKRAIKTVNLHTKHSGTSEDRSILHPQVNKGSIGLVNQLKGAGKCKKEIQLL